ncbi:thioesterase II family protein [Kitasatospora sp. NPDC058965]|uniref:thioesterase II family protein n=1 Tax=Kitasatospora sp. NPDC058965 TaxID=3346682 RepID=UPI0036BB84C7
MGEELGAWIRRFHPAPLATTRLICFPHAGGSASYYFPVSRALSPGLDVLAVQYPGRQDRRHEPNAASVAELADAVVRELDGWTDRPLALFGHSLGASVAFEVAERLEARGIVPAALFASGRRAPSRFRDENVHLKDDDGLIADIKKLAGTDDQVLGDPDIVRMVLPSVRADYRLAETYRWSGSTRLSCPVYALTGDDDPQVTLDEAGAWASHTTGPFSLKVYPGGHFYLNSQAPAVLELIRSELRPPVVAQ